MTRYTVDDFLGEAREVVREHGIRDGLEAIRENTERLLRRQEVEKIVGLSCATIYRLMRKGQFPLPIKLGGQTVRWKKSELDAYIDNCPKSSGQGHPPRRS